MQSYCEAREVVVGETDELIEDDLLCRLDGTFFHDPKKA